MRSIFIFPFCILLHLHLIAQSSIGPAEGEIIFDIDTTLITDSAITPPPPPPSLDEMMNTIFTSVQEYPRFTKQGRREDLSDYLYEHRTYPNTGDAQKKNGTVYVRFIVGSDGTVREPVIVSGMGSPYDEEALRIISALPKFYKPARLFDMDVNCYLGAHVYFYPE